MDLVPSKGLLQRQSQSVPSAVATKQEVLLPPEGSDKTDKDETESSKLLMKNLTEDKGTEVMNAHKEATQAEGETPLLYSFALLMVTN